MHVNSYNQIYSLDLLDWNEAWNLNTYIVKSIYTLCAHFVVFWEGFIRRLPLVRATNHWPKFDSIESPSTPTPWLEHTLPSYKLDKDLGVEWYEMFTFQRESRRSERVTKLRKGITNSSLGVFWSLSHGEFHRPPPPTRIWPSREQCAYQMCLEYELNVPRSDLRNYVSYTWFLHKNTWSQTVARLQKIAKCT